MPEEARLILNARWMSTSNLCQEKFTAPYGELKVSTSTSDHSFVRLMLIGLDPNLDTPVEILHTVLLGMVKYMWRDAVDRIKDDGKRTLIARLDSFNVSGLNLSPLPGHTFVNYYGSLVGRDFRAIVQAAPFVLHGLLSEELLNMWKALAVLVPLVWVPEIPNIDTHVVRAPFPCVHIKH